MNRFLALKKKPSPLITVLGYFDGVHLGHRSLLAAAEKLRKEYGGRIAVWTFDALPGKDILTPSSLRAGWLLQYGADLVIFDSFERVKNMNPGRFTAEILRENLGSLACVCGYTYHFGSGGAAELERLCRENGILCITAGEIKGYAEGKSVTVCSTLIRRLVSEGKLADAYSLLGHHFAACGEVVHGRQFGRTAGMPTINQLPPHNGIMPPDGVYATYCMVEGGYYPSVTNIGWRPAPFRNRGSLFRKRRKNFRNAYYRLFRQSLRKKHSRRLYSPDPRREKIRFCGRACPRGRKEYHNSKKML